MCKIKEKAELLTGRVLLGGKKYDKGMRQYLRLYEQVDISNSTKQEALFGLCLSYWNLKKYKKSKSCLEVYIENFPLANNLGVAHLMLSQVYLKLNIYNLAEKMLTDLTENYIDDKIYYKSLYWLGEARYRQKKYKEAEKVYNRLIHLKNINILNQLYGMVGLAWVYYDQNIYDKAYLLFQDVTKLNFDHKFIRDSWVMAGNCLYLLKEYEQSRDIYVTFLNQYPLAEQAGEVFYKKGLALMQMGQFEKALTAWETLSKNFPDNKYADDGLFRAGNMLYKNGFYFKSGEIFLMLYENFPKSTYRERARLEMGNCFYNQCKYLEALKIYQDIIKNALNQEICHKATYYIGWCYYLLKKEDKTLDIFQGFLKNYPKSELASQILFWLGENEYNKKNFKQSLKYFEELIQAYSDSDLVDNSYFLASRSSFQLKDFKKTISLLSLLIVGYSDSDLIPDSLFLRGQAYFQLGKNEDAIDNFIIFETAYEDSYLRKPAFEILGELFFIENKFKNALIYFKKANKINIREHEQNNMNMVLKQAHCHKNLLDLNKALELGLKVIYDDTSKKYFKTAVDFCVEIYKEQNKYSHAIRLLTKLLKEGKNIDKGEIKHRIRKFKYYDSHRKDVS